jgi:antitoxin component YwqK of YwqJK toxin-antitoxin module
MNNEYCSSIPKEAIERVTAHYPTGQKQKAEYLLNEEVVGVRFFHETGEPESEYGLKNGVMHGVWYRWDTPGILSSAEPFVDGLPHNLAPIPPRR